MQPGDGLFETLKVVDGAPFALTRHVQRMATSAADLGLPVVDVESVRGEVLDRLGETRDAGELPEVARLRLLWTSRPDGSGALDLTTSDLPTNDSATNDLATGAGAAHVRTTSWRRNRASATRGHKGTDYVDNLAALAGAVADGASEAIFADTAGMVCEGSGTNVFYVVDDELRTPALTTGCLPGITRALVLEWCGAREVEEPLGVLSRASELFLTSSTREVQPVASCDGWTYAAPGPVTADVMTTWRRWSRETPDP